MTKRLFNLKNILASISLLVVAIILVTTFNTVTVNSLAEVPIGVQDFKISEATDTASQNAMIDKLGIRWDGTVKYWSYVNEAVGGQNINAIRFAPAKVADAAYPVIFQLDKTHEHGDYPAKSVTADFYGSAAIASGTFESIGFYWGINSSNRYMGMTAGLFCSSAKGLVPCFMRSCPYISEEKLVTDSTRQSIGAGDERKIIETTTLSNYGVDVDVANKLKEITSVTMLDAEKGYRYRVKAYYDEFGACLADITYDICLTTGEVISFTVKGYSFYTASDFSEKTLGIVYNSPTKKTKCYLGDISVEYDLSSNGIYIDTCITNLPDVNTVALTDKIEVENVYEQYNALTATEKANVSSANVTKLNAVYLKYRQLAADAEQNKSTDEIITFEPGEAGETYMSSGTVKVVANSQKDKVNGSQYVLQVESTKYDTFSTLDSSLNSGEKRISNLSGKIYVATAGNATVVFDYYDSNNWQGYQFARSGNVLWSYLIQCTDGTVAIKSSKSFSFNSYDEISLINGWIGFSIEYELTKAKATVSFNASNGNTYLGEIAPVNLIDSSFVRVGFTGNSASNCFFDDISISYYDSPYYIEANDFMTAYSEMFDLVPASAFVSVTDNGRIQLMRQSYDNLSDLAKRYLGFTNVHIESLEKAYQSLTESADFQSIKTADTDRYNKAASVSDPYKSYAYENDFEGVNSTRDFKRALGNGTPNGATVTTEYSEVFGSNVLKISSSALSISAVTLKDYLIPGDTPQVSSVSYKMYMPGNLDSYYSMYISLDYKDSSDMFIWGWYNALQPDESYRVRQHQLIYGTRTYRGGGWSFIDDLMWGDVWTVNITYTEFGQATVLLYDQHGGSTVITIKNTHLDQIFCLLNFGREALYDDLKVTYRTGAYTVDEDISDIKVYYTGNTYVAPGDIAYINGEKLGTNAYTVSIMQLENNPYDGSGTLVADFVDRQYYDYDGVHDGEYSKSFVSKTWDEAAATPVKILQRAENSIKIKIPETFSDGIYAVKIATAKGKSAITYINVPAIDYGVGDDGGEKTATCESMARTAPGGTVKLVGTNLALADDVSKLHVKMVNHNNPTEYYWLDGSISVDSDYAVSVNIPANLSPGKQGTVYELYLYNGYGDTTAFSIPTLVNVAPDLRSTWKSTVFNIMDYGATGKNEQNATPCFVNALAAINQNGGGILYLPAGTYRLQDGLIIPENCQIIGEKMEEVIIIIAPYNWLYNKFECSYIFKFTKNIAIKNITIGASRVSGIFGGFGSESENLYFENIETHITPTAGAASSAPNELKGLAENLALMTATENVNPIFNFDICATNVHFNNVNLQDCKDDRNAVWNYDNGSFYWSIENYKAKVSDPAWSPVVASYAIITDSVNAPTLWGKGVYTAKSQVLNNTTNNREGWVADLNAPYRGAIVPLSEDSGNLWFTCSKSVNSLALYPGQVYVANGQGVGQTRTIVDSKTVKNASGINATMFKIDRPFAVMPNANSVAIVRRPREDMYFVDNYMENCAAGFAFYGGFADVVYDGNVYNSVYTKYNMGVFDDVNWYCSYVNEESVYDVAICNVYGDGGHIGYRMQGLSGTNAQVGFLMRNCSMDGLYLDFQANGANYSVDFIFDNNVFKDYDYIFNCLVTNTTIGRNEKYTGWYITRNGYYGVDNIFSEGSYASFMSAAKTTNSVGSRNLIITDIIGQTIASELGDVNCDGKITAKDVTMIKYYVVGKITLNQAQRVSANVNGDNTVDLRDASFLRLYVLEMVSELDGSGTIEPDSSSADPSSSDPSSSDPSSSEPSSSEPSSSDPSSSEEWTPFY